MNKRTKTVFKIINGNIMLIMKLNLFENKKYDKMNVVKFVMK